MPGYLKYGLIALGLFCIFFVLTRMGLFSGQRPTNLGVNSGKLSPCPETPNCVSTQAVDSEHTIPALAMTGTMQQAHNTLISVLDDLPRTNVVVNNQDYVHVEFHTGIMKYTDDVEFWLDNTTGVIHFRSASRLGVSDLGLNRRRMESFRKKFMLEQ